MQSIEENQTERTSEADIKMIKKRVQYKRMTEDKKRDLIFRVMYLNENVRTVCHELGFNFSTGRNLVQKYKKTGEYNPLDQVSDQPQSDKQKPSSGTNDSEGKLKCPLGVIVLSDEKIQIVTSKSYSMQDENFLLKAHEQLLHRRLI
jgi:hypothetical protein